MSSTRGIARTALPFMKNRRRKYLIHPRIQILAGMVFVGATAVGVLLLAVLDRASLTRAAIGSPGVNERFLTTLDLELQRNLLIVFLALIPLSLAAAFLLLFRVVGPLYRMQSYLRSLLRGEARGPCRIRKRDELQGFCELLNAATEHLREPGAAPPETGESESIPAELLAGGDRSPFERQQQSA